MKTALEYSKQACDTMIRKFKVEELPPVNRFFYHQGVFLSGMSKVYEMCGEKKYYAYIKAWVDYFLRNEEKKHEFTDLCLDDLQAGILLYLLYDKTGDACYKTALDDIMEILRNWKCNPLGGFWHHGAWGQDQMWLDSLYMGGPIQAEYAARYHEPELFDVLVNQAVLMKDNMQDNTGLLRHAWDYRREMQWCDPVTGLSGEVWGRAQGWYVVAILDILEFMPASYPGRSKLIEIEREIMEAVAKYQDEKSGMWYQVVNMGNMENNWLETSCTALFAYAMAKGVRLNVLDKKYLDIAQKAYQGILENAVTFEGEDLLLQKVCVGTCVGTYDFYINRRTVVNDLHGMGVFLLMCAEFARGELEAEQKTEK